jgi:type IX secretion system PorP/SprF family membrane protein
MKAQQTASFAQYAFNVLAINPGYAGSHNLLSASFISRVQNVGIEGAPNTQTFSIHAPLWNKSLSVGGMMIRDKIGVINQSGVHGILAYRIFFDEEGEHSLGFGMQFGMITYSANYADLLSFQPNDPFFGQNIRQSRPNVGTGVFYRTSNYYLGLSMPHLMNNVFDRGENFTTVNQSVPVLLNGGYVYTFSPILKIKPNFLLKMLDGRIVEFDLNASVQLDDLLWVGMSYKFPGINLLTEFRLTDQLLMGYSYSLDKGKLRNIGVGTHELLLNFRFKFTKYRLVSPRYF